MTRGTSQRRLDEGASVSIWWHCCSSENWCIQVEYYMCPEYTASHLGWKFSLSYKSSRCRKPLLSHGKELKWPFELGLTHTFKHVEENLCWFKKLLSVMQFTVKSNNPVYSTSLGVLFSSSLKSRSLDVTWNTPVSSAAVPVSDFDHHRLTTLSLAKRHHPPDHLMVDIINLFDLSVWNPFLQFFHLYSVFHVCLSLYNITFYTGTRP